MQWTETAGCAGMLAILVAYVLLSNDALSAHGWWYQGLNVFGALGIVITCFAKSDYPPLALNGSWLLISLVTMARMMRAKKKAPA